MLPTGWLLLATEAETRRSRPSSVDAAARLVKLVKRWSAFKARCLKFYTFSIKKLLVSYCHAVKVKGSGKVKKV